MSELPPAELTTPATSTNALELKGKLWFPHGRGNTLAVCSPKITPIPQITHIPIGVWWYKLRVLPQRVPTCSIWWISLIPNRTDISMARVEIPRPSLLEVQLVQNSLGLHPRKRTNVPQKGTISIGNTSSNHWFSGDMLVFRGVNLFNFLGSSPFVGASSISNERDRWNINQQMSMPFAQCMVVYLDTRSCEKSQETDLVHNAAQRRTLLYT